MRPFKVWYIFWCNGDVINYQRSPLCPGRKCQSEPGSQILHPRQSIALLLGLGWSYECFQSVLYYFFSYSSPPLGVRSLWIYAGKIRVHRPCFVPWGHHDRSSRVWQCSGPIVIVRYSGWPWRWAASSLPHQLGHYSGKRHILAWIGQSVPGHSCYCWPSWPPRSHSYSLSPSTAASPQHHLFSEWHCNPWLSLHCYRISSWTTAATPGYLGICILPTFPLRCASWCPTW